MNTIDDATRNQDRASHLDRMTQQILMLGRARAAMDMFGAHSTAMDRHLDEKAAKLLADVNAMIAEAVDSYLREWEN